MNKIQKLTKMIRDNEEKQLSLGTLWTLSMIDDESKAMEMEIEKLKGNAEKEGERCR